MRSTITERWLDKLEVKWEYDRNYPLERVDLRDDVAAQIRVNGTDPAHIEDFERLAKTTDHRDVPALIVWRNGGPKDLPIDCIHRVSGFRRGGLAGHDAYVVTTSDPAVIARMRRTANIVLNGLGITDNERFQHAYKYLKDFPGTKLTEAAAIFQINDRSLGAHVRAEDTRLGLIARGMPERHANTLTRLALNVMYGQRPVVQDALARLAVSRNLSAPEVKDYVAQVEAAPTEADGLALLSASSAPANSNGKPKHKPTVIDWKRATNALRSVVSRIQDGSKDMTQLQRREIGEAAMELSVELSTLSAALLKK